MHPVVSGTVNYRAFKKIPRIPSFSFMSMF